MQGKSRLDRELLDAGEMAGHLVPPGSVFAFLAEHRRELFGDSFTADLFPSRTGRSVRDQSSIPRRCPVRVLSCHVTGLPRQPWRAVGGAVIKDTRAQLDGWSMASRRRSWRARSA